MLVIDYAEQLAAQVTAGLGRLADLLSTPAAARLLRAWGAVPREWRAHLLRLMGSALRWPARRAAPPPTAPTAPPAPGGVTLLCTVTPLPGRRQKVTITIDGE